MNNANKLLQEVYEKYSEHLEHMDDDEAVGLIIRALASIAARESELAERYKMALKRCELMRK